MAGHEMKRLERIIAGVLGAGVCLLVISSIWMLSSHADALGQTFTKSIFGVDGVFFGTGLFSLFIIASALIGLSLDRLSPSSFVFIMIVSLVWMLVIEPILKIQSDTPYNVLEWIADALIGALLLSPVLIHKMSVTAGVKAPDFAGLGVPS